MITCGASDAQRGRGHGPVTTWQRGAAGAVTAARGHVVRRQLEGPRRATARGLSSGAECANETTLSAGAARRAAFAAPRPRSSLLSAAWRLPWPARTRGCCVAEGSQAAFDIRLRRIIAPEATARACRQGPCWQERRGPVRLMACGAVARHVQHSVVRAGSRVAEARLN